MIEMQLKKGCAEIKIEGDIVSEAVNELKHAMEEALEKGCTEMTLDLSSVQYINSSGLNVLIRSFTKLKEQEKKFSLKNVSPELCDFFESTNLSHLLPIENLRPR